MEAAKHDVERKSLDQRHQMSDLERLRHSCAHVLATAKKLASEAGYPRCASSPRLATRALR